MALLIHWLQPNACEARRRFPFGPAGPPVDALRKQIS